jgi:hypothetical protein
LQFYTAAKRNDTIEELLRYFTNSVVSESLPSRLPSGVQNASKKTIDIYDGAGLYGRSS